MLIVSVEGVCCTCGFGNGGGVEHVLGNKFAWLGVDAGRGGGVGERGVERWGVDAGREGVERWGVGAGRSGVSGVSVWVR